MERTTTLIALGFLAFVFIPTAPVQADCVTPPAGIVAWWPAEGNANDVIGGNNGTLEGGATFAPGKVGQGFRFDGTNGFVQIPDSDLLKPTNVTVEAWVWLDPNLPSGRGGEQIVFKKNTWTAWFEGYSLLKTSIDNGDGTFTDRFQFCVSRYGNQVAINSQTIAQRGVWYHVAATYDGNQSILYVNGVAEATATPGFALDYDTTPVFIGTSGTWSPYLSMFGGIIDEASIYNRALGSNEIAAIYNAGSAGKCPVTAPISTNCVSAPAGLVGWWKGDGNTVDSFAGNNGVNQNITYTNGVDGQAFACDPENFPYFTYTGIQVADQPAYALTNSLTIEGWVRPRGDSYIIFWRGDHRPGLDPYYVSMQHNHTLRFGICDADGNSAYVETTLNYFIWTHVAATLDDSTGALSIYTNGVLAVQTNTAVRPFGTLEADQSPGVGIGNLNDGGNQFPFIGDIDEIALYNRALTPTEIHSIYNAGSAGKCAPAVPTNSCVTPPSGLVSWWSAEGNANDIIGGNNGVPTGGLTYTNGEVGQAFVFNGSTSYIPVPASPSLDIGSAGSGITIEGWIKPNQLGPVGAAGLPIVEWDSDSTDGAQFWVENGFTLFANIEDTGHNQHLIQSAPGSISTNSFQHVALTYDKSSGAAMLYINGVMVVSNNFGNITPQTTYPLNIGRRTGQPIGDGDTFNGLIDELSLYNRALSQTEIQSIYNAGSAGKCAPANSSVPTISNIAPASATNGSSITISGSNFSSNPADDIIYFGAVRATVLSASPTSLVVTVPTGATYAPVTVTVNGLTVCSSTPFLPTFNGGSSSGPLALAPRLDLPTGDGPGTVVIADLDGDGKPDLLVNSGSHVISIYQNISTTGTLTAGSFAPRLDLTLASGGENAMVAADVDGDGKLDIVVLDRDLNQVMILKNLSTPGILTTNSFAAPVAFPTGTDPRGLAVRDLDGDGRPELIVANWDDNTVSVFQNTGVPGITTNSFAPAITFPVGTSPQSLAVADLDGDGQPDIVTANNNYVTDNSISILRNTSSPGNISFATHVDLAGLATSYCVAVGDLDGDGKPDLAVSSFDYGQSVSVYRNTSTPGSITTNSFAPHVDFSAGGWDNAVAIGDLDGDGKPDLAVVTQLPDHLSVFKNNSTPGSLTTDSFAPRQDFSAGYNNNGVAIGDLDGDGRPDIAFSASYAATLSIYQNQTALDEAPFISSPTTNQTVTAASGVVLSVTAGGTGPFSYQWSFNGTNIAGATNNTLSLENLHSNQSGNYAVTVTGADGSVTGTIADIVVTAQNLLAYNYSGTEKITTAGQSFSYVYSGQMFFIPATTNGVFVGWGAINGKKQYWMSDLSDYMMITVPGPGSQTFTVLGEAGQGHDTNGYPHLWAYLHKGKNSSLTIGKKQYFTFPATFAGSDTHVYPDPNNGSMILTESSSTFIFATQTTQKANNNGQTLTDLVNTVTQKLVNQGYQKQ